MAAQASYRLIHKFQAMLPKVVNQTSMAQRAVLRLTEAERAEIGELFRKKLERLRTEERRSRGRAAHFTASRRRHRLGAIETEPNDDAILSSAELGQLLGVHRRTVARWGDDGMPTIRTIGGHRRFRWVDVKRWLNQAGAATP